MLETHDHHIETPTEEAHRQAYNAAFDELGLNWQWDPATYARLPGSDRERVRAYLQQEQPHLLRAYEPDFLADAIENAKERCYRVMTASRAEPLRYSGSSAGSRTRPWA